MKLLIVDDHPANLRLLRAQLEAEGHAVLDAANGAVALERLRTETVDGVIADILMPEMDGYRMCMEVRRDPKLARLPFVLYTSTYNSDTDRALAKQAGADAYISKPAPIPTIIAALEGAMNATRPGMPSAASAAEQTEVLKAYSEALVRKLEDRNLNLVDSLAQLKQAHEEARRADALYRLVFENVPVGITITSPDGKVISANPMMLQLLGYLTLEDALAALRGEARNAYADPAAQNDYWTSLRRDSVVRNFQARMRRRDGTELAVSIDGKLLTDEWGDPHLLVSIVRPR